MAPNINSNIGVGRENLWKVKKDCWEKCSFSPSSNCAAGQMIEEAKLSEKVRRAARAGASVRSPPRQNDITPRLTTTDFSLPRRNMVRSLTTMIALPQPRRKKFRRENYVTVSFWRTDAKILSFPSIYLPHRWTTNIIKDCMRNTNVSWRRGYTWRKFDWDIIIRQTRRKKVGCYSH